MDAVAIRRDDGTNADNGYKIVLSKVQYYRAEIYRHVGDNSHDVIITISDIPLSGAPPCDGSLDLVYSRTVASSRVAKMSRLTSYMHWKFRHCQKTGNRALTPVRSAGRFTYLRKPVEWIISIVEVEFDYHIGSAECARNENAERLREYRKSQYNGYAAPARV